MQNRNNPASTRLCAVKHTPELQRIEAATHLDAGELFPGLAIELEEIWQV